jgi:hypothetical protein
VEDAHEYRGRGAYLNGTPAAERDVATFAGRAGTAAEPPEDGTPVRSEGGWQLESLC